MSPTYNRGKDEPHDYKDGDTAKDAFPLPTSFSVAGDGFHVLGFIWLVR
jgi:hypothetical protein